MVSVYKIRFAKIQINADALGSTHLHGEQTDTKSQPRKRACLAISCQSFLGTIMLADSTDLYNVRNAGMFIYVDDTDETYKKAIDEGATSITEVANQDYGKATV